MLSLATGSPHDFTSLKDVAAKVKQATEPLKQKVEDRFDEVSALIKEITIVLSEWDIGTEEGVRFLHHTRDEQVGNCDFLPCILYLHYNMRV